MYLGPNLVRWSGLDHFRQIDGTQGTRQAPLHAKTVQVSDDDVETPLNSPVPQLDTPSILSQASDKLAEAGQKIVESETQLRRMRWVHQMSEYYSYDALATGFRRLDESDEFSIIVAGELKNNTVEYNCME